MDCGGIDGMFKGSAMHVVESREFREAYSKAYEAAYSTSDELPCNSDQVHLIARLHRIILCLTLWCPERFWRDTVFSANSA